MLASVPSDQPHAGPPGAAAASSGEGARGRIDAADLLMAAAFALLLVVQISHHEMWRDEIHSWGLVRASSSLPELYANLRFTGHPGLWYLILWPVSWFTDSPYALQAVHASIVALLIGLIALASPFSKLEKLLLLSSYFVLYEYTVVSRNYGIGFLVALLYAHLRATRPDRVYLNALLLGLLANTNLSAFLLSGVFALEYLVELLLRRAAGFWRAVRALLPPAAIYLAFVALALATMWPSPDISWRTTGAPLQDVWDPLRLLGMIAGNVEGLVTVYALSHWNAAAGGSLSILSIAALPVLAFVMLLIFRGHSRLLLIPGLTFAGSVAVGQLVYANSIRHWGVNFIAFVAALWVQRVWSPVRSYLAIGILAVSAAGGIAISVQQFPRAFSEGEATAEWIRDNVPADVALVGTPDTLVSVVAQYLGKPIYFLDCSCTDTYLVFHKRRDAFDDSQIAERLARAADELEGRSVLFLTTHRLDGWELADMRGHGIVAALLAAFDHASTDENYFVYSVAAVETEATEAAELRSEIRGAL